jgi:hypothetical protein
MLSEFLDCPFLIAPLVFSNLCPVSCVPNVVRVSGLSMLDCPFAFQSSMDNPETVITLGTQDTGQRLEKTKGEIKNGQSRNSDNIGYTGQRQSRNSDNIGYTRHRIKTIQKLCLVYPMLSEFLDCLYPVSCVPNVVRVSGLSLSCVPNVVTTLGTQDTG